MATTTLGGVLRYPDTFPHDPPHGHPVRFLAWLAARQAWLLLGAMVVAALNFVALALTPYLLGEAIDAGLEQGATAELWRYAGLLLALGAVTAVAAAVRHVAEVANWMRAAFTCSDMLGKHVTRTGDQVTRKLATGEVVATVATDAVHMGNLMESLPMFVGGLVSYLLIAGLLLQQSLILGVAVLVGLPLVTAAVAVLVPPLQRRQARHREATGELTSLASDTVSGLRVLRGIGGEDVFAARYREQSQAVRRAGVGVANTQSILAALQVLLPGLFVVGVVWFGANLAIAGEITVGQLVAFYGYTAFLAEPLRQVSQFIQFLTRALVAARRISRVLAVTPAAGRLGDADGDADPLPLEGEVALRDPGSGVVIRRGLLTVLVSPTPETSAVVLRRLARLDDAESAGVTIADLPIVHQPLAAVRRTVVLSDATPQLFTGTLRHEVDVLDSGDQLRVVESLAVADARDVLESIPGGLDGEITEKGRSLSGGQRQRVALARATFTGAPVLLLVEPTSAVDAHTESRIAINLKRHRAGLTTVVVTASPLVLEHADEVVFLDATGVRAHGSHRVLLQRAQDGDPAAMDYRRVVTRRNDTEEVKDAAACR